MNNLNSQHNEDKNCKTNLFLYNNYFSFSGYVLPIVENTFLFRFYTSSSVLPHDGSFPLLTIRASLSIAAVIFAQNSSQQMFSSAVTTREEQRANTLYNLDHVDNIDFWVA